MKRIIASLAAIAFCTAGFVYAISEGGPGGEWPKELEPLRKQAWTWRHGLIGKPSYDIPFAKREEFESVWPHLLKVKSKGAPIILTAAPKKDFFKGKAAGVLIHAPPATTTPIPEAPLAGTTNVRERWLYTTYIELVVDGSIVDLNRISLPADTPIIDERFADGKKK